MCHLKSRNVCCCHCRNNYLLLVFRQDSILALFGFQTFFQEGFGFCYDTIIFIKMENYVYKISSLKQNNRKQIKTFAVITLLHNVKIKM